jgi:hypothetical protein
MDKGTVIDGCLAVTKVWDRQRAADALLRLQMTYVIPKEAYGTTWRVPQSYAISDLRSAFESLPARFANQHLIFRLRDIEAIESSRDITVCFEPAEAAHH